MKRTVLLAISFIFAIMTCTAADYLFIGGKSAYSIVVDDNASTSEKTAAKELQHYLKEISGATLPIVSKANGKSIYVGWRESSGVSKPDDGDESFTYCTNGDDLYIYGGRERGTMYGVFSFLENELGVRWYTSDFTKVPKLSSYQLKALNHTEHPAVKRRLNYYQQVLNDNVWAAHNKQNESYKIVNNEYGNLSSYYGIHTLFTLVPPDKYFEEHPEYYSLYNGKRINDGQMCLSNKDVLKIATNSLLKEIEENPGYWVYDVSQMDNRKFCQCPKCTKIAKKYGGQSGLMVWFVNQIAAAVDKKYPGKLVGTFAYMYTRHAPTGIKPRENVVIRLCDIECCFAHPLNSNCSHNTSFIKDIKDWNKIAHHLYLWDYVVDFYQYLAPFPNFNVLADNIKTLADNNAIGIMEEGEYESPWGEFSELRQWVLSRLLWNPNLNTDKLVSEFITDYYGKAAPDVQCYYTLTQDQVNDSTHIFFNTLPTAKIYTDGYIAEGRKVLEHAASEVAGDTTYTKRVNRVLAQVYFMQVARDSTKAKADGTYDKLANILKTDYVHVAEGEPELDAYLKKYYKGK